jgi:hypothetical protein
MKNFLIGLACGALGLAIVIGVYIVVIVGGLNGDL